MGVLLRSQEGRPFLIGLMATLTGLSGMVILQVSLSSTHGIWTRGGQRRRAQKLCSWASWGGFCLDIVGRHLGRIYLLTVRLGERVLEKGVSVIQVSTGGVPVHFNEQYYILALQCVQLESMTHASTIFVFLEYWHKLQSTSIRGSTRACPTGLGGQEQEWVPRAWPAVVRTPFWKEQ